MCLVLLLVTSWSGAYAARHRLSSEAFSEIASNESYHKPLTTSQAAVELTQTALEESAETIVEESFKHVGGELLGASLDIAMKLYTVYKVSTDLAATANVDLDDTTVLGVDPPKDASVCEDPLSEHSFHILAAARASLQAADRVLQDIGFTSKAVQEQDNIITLFLRNQARDLDLGRASDAAFLRCFFAMLLEADVGVSGATFAGSSSMAQLRNSLAPIAQMTGCCRQRRKHSVGIFNAMFGETTYDYRCKNRHISSKNWQNTEKQTCYSDRVCGGDDCHVPLAGGPAVQRLVKLSVELARTVNTA